MAVSLLLLSSPVEWACIEDSEFTFSFGVGPSNACPSKDSCISPLPLEGLLPRSGVASPLSELFVLLAGGGDIQLLSSKSRFSVDHGSEEDVFGEIFSSVVVLVSLCPTDVAPAGTSASPLTCNICAVFKKSVNCS